MWITDYLGVLGQHIQVTYDAAGYLVDQNGNWYEIDNGSVYDAAGTYVGQLATWAGSYLEDTRDAVIEGATDVGKTFAISSAGALFAAGALALFLIYKVVK